MARGGGSRGGGFSGGSRGGGGGFRGGGSRSYGSSRSYRSSRRHYRHNSYYGRPYYGRPYYGRRYYRGGYYGPGNAIAGIVIFGIIMIFVVPLIFTAVIATDSTHSINLVQDSTQAFKFNKALKGDIDFSVGGSSLYVLDHEPSLTGPVAVGTHTEPIPGGSIINNDFRYYSLYVTKGSTVTVTWDASTLVEIHVVKDSKFNDWKNGDNVQSDYTSGTSDSHTFSFTDNNLYDFVIYASAGQVTVPDWTFSWNLKTYDVGGASPVATSPSYITSSEYSGNWVVVKSNTQEASGQVVVKSKLPFGTTYLLSLVIFGGLIILLIRRGIARTKDRYKNRPQQTVQQGSTPLQQTSTQPQQSSSQSQSSIDSSGMDSQPAKGFSSQSSQYRTRPTPRYCPECGAGLVPSSRFCEECGTAV